MSDTPQPKKGQPVHSIGGALTSGKVLPYWQIPASLLDSYARRALEGSLPRENKEPYPIHNWRKGLDNAKYVRDRACHGFKHFLKILNGIEDAEDSIQDNIDALTWFCGFINEANRLYPDVVKQAFYSECREEKP